MNYYRYIHMGKDKTHEFKSLNEHINHSKGVKTVCVTTCLSFFGVDINSYSYTSSNKNSGAFKNVLRRFGYSVRSKKTEFKALKHPTMTSLKKEIKKSDYTKDDFFIVWGFQSKASHLMVLDGEGDIVIDTAPKKKWRIKEVSIVTF